MSDILKKTYRLFFEIWITVTPEAREGVKSKSGGARPEYTPCCISEPGILNRTRSREESILRSHDLVTFAPAAFKQTTTLTTSNVGSEILKLLMIYKAMFIDDFCVISLRLHIIYTT